MFVLGVHGGSKREDEDHRAGFAMHDSAAVLVRDGQVVSAIEEERLSRIKHTNCFPARAIRYCLGENGLSLADVDRIAINSAEHMVDVVAKRVFLANPNVKGQLDARRFLGSLFEREFGDDVSHKLRFCRHHFAHAWSAYAPSGYDHSLILVLDGDGDNLSGLVLEARGDRLTRLGEYGLEQSIGNFYTDVISLLGYKRFDEYKVMGLAPYGNPETYRRLFEKFYRLLPAGNYELADADMVFMRFMEAGIVDQARRKGEPFTQVHKDVAAALQATLEKLVLHILQHYQSQTKHKNLCFAGGVAHNCTLNGKILYSGLFSRMFVQPAAHDAGGAMGSALSVFYEEQEPPARRPPKLEHLFYGTDIGDDAEAIGRRLGRWGEFVSFERVDNVAERTAHLIADGSVVGWVQGRSEFGPRALGNRSILADPRPAENKSLINQMVKKREAYRPFAPSVLEEHLHEYFDVPANRAEFPFMIFVLNVQEHMRETLGAVTHVDGTARVQTVSQRGNPKYWELINEFRKLTGVPILLNTSFNNNAEPIVDSIDDAVVCYLTTGLHYLVVGDYLAVKKEAAPSPEALQTLVPKAPRSRRLVKREALGEAGEPQTVYEIEGTMSHFFGRTVVEILPETFRVLMEADGEATLARLLRRAGIDGEARPRVLREFESLWAERIVVLRPEEA
ncbi:MAG TPA: carbamoyltransferase C-terminal domain-containing protein [Pyrinomonadaceae bacterium]|jgi:carbamoyltransferase